MLKSIKKFLKEEIGAETVEWVAIAAVIVVVGIAAYNDNAIGDIIDTGVGKISAAITAL